MAMPQSRVLMLIAVIGMCLSTSSGQLMCFHCDDCDVLFMNVVQCGADRPMLPFPDNSESTTTIIPQTIPTVAPETTTIYPPEVPTIVPETTTPTPTPTIEHQPPTTTPTETTTLTTSVAPEITTQESVAPETTISPTITTINPETTTTISTTPGEPILTPPTHPTFTSQPITTTQGGPILTPPTHPTPLPVVPVNFGIVIPVPPSPLQFACLSVRRNVNNRTIVSRGCAQLRTNLLETCDYATNGKHNSCAVCIGSLCNGNN